MYDAVGNVTEEHHGYHVAGVKETYLWQHEHDKLGNRIATIRPDGHRVDVLNYGSGHIHGLLFGQRDIFNLERDKLHRETQRVQGNALQQTLAYDKAGRLSSQQLMGATQWSRQYQYDTAGQLTGIADSRSCQLSYRYDPVDYLLEAATPKGMESFRFDTAGNLLDNAPAAGGHQSDSLLGNLLSQYAGHHYRYDSRGNLVEKRVNGGLTQLEWNSHNCLPRLTALNNQHTEYHDYPLSHHISKLSQSWANFRNKNNEHATHPNYMNAEINFIRQQMDNFYRKIFTFDNAKRNENKKLKAEIISIFLKAKQEKNKSLENESMKLLIEHTGCQEDYEILKEIIFSHPNSEFLSETELIAIMETPLPARWM
ncbi:hypothetical protein VA599_19845 [Chromobacterium sp. TRC.1.1.SA]|uniref:Teneurin-like YD-shell domain-containing protein n=1 Tax=Chromobacterium indicum TaxID=3110228 RepID=A0ABV0CQ44_9NEIS